MNGAHDLGGKHCLGPIAPESEFSEPVFHHEWERRVFALTLATGMLGQWNIDESRFARERQHPQRYLANSYYENWLAGLEKLLDEKQMLTSDSSSRWRAASPDCAAQLLAAGSPTSRAAQRAPAFACGQRVRVRKLSMAGHTRAPAYVQGTTGVIAQFHGWHCYPDQRARGLDSAEPLYSVCFTGQSLWGPNSEASEVLIDLWEPYLERAENND